MWTLSRDPLLLLAGGARSQHNIQYSIYIVTPINTIHITCVYIMWEFEYAYKYVSTYTHNIYHTPPIAYW